MIATRDGLVHVVLPCKPGCPKPEVGDYLQADGEKVHEYLFIAENVTLTRNGRRVR